MSARFGAVPVKVSTWVKILLIAVSLVALLPLYFGVQTIWGAATLHYRITSDALEIIYAGKQRTIQLGSIQSIEIADDPHLVRIAGSNSPGIYTGRWSSSLTGRITLYATRLHPMVIVRTSAGSWGLTPSDPISFARALEGRTTGDFPPAEPSGHPFLFMVPLILVLCGLIPATWWAISLTYRFPERLTYELGASELVIETGWRPVRIPYSEIDSIEATTLKGWPLRLMGSELKGVHWGLFSWAAVPGRRIHLYATQLRPIVLIRAGGRSFGLSPADADRFIRDLKERIGRE